MTTKLEQAARQALEALETDEQWGFVNKKVLERRIPAITALRSALADSAASSSKALAESNMNLNCKSVQARLATSRWYVRAEQAEQKPVGWTAASNLVDDGYGHNFSVVSSEPANTTSEPYVPLYADPVQQAEQEPEKQLSELGYASRLAREICKKHYPDCLENWKPLDSLYGVLTQIDNMVSGLSRNTQAARTKDLTDDALDVLWCSNGFDPMEFARAVIAADREKNK